jgi:hypothetical protein
MRGILVVLVSLAACSDDRADTVGENAAVVVQLASTSPTLVVNGVAIADSRKLQVLRDAMKPLISSSAEAGRAVVKADRSVTAARIFRVLNALALSGIRRFRFESRDPNWRIAALDWDVPPESYLPRVETLHCLGIIVLSDSEGNVDFGDGHVERREWKRWLLASTGSPRVDFAVGELCLPMDAPFEVFHQLLDDMVSAELDAVYVGWAEPYSYDLGARMFVRRHDIGHPKIRWLGKSGD